MRAIGCLQLAAATVPALLVLGAAVAGAAFDWRGKPVGDKQRHVFALANAGRPVPDWVWEVDWIAGVALRGHWKTFPVLQSRTHAGGGERHDPARPRQGGLCPHRA